jgi:hypothetical protein
MAGGRRNDVKENTPKRSRRIKGADKLFDTALFTAVTVILSTIQVLLGSFVFMIIVGVISHDLTTTLQPISFMSSLVILGLAEILFTIMRITTDFRDVFKEVLDPEYKGK